MFRRCDPTLVALIESFRSQPPAVRRKHVLRDFRDGSRSVQWVLPPQLPESCEVSVGRDERDAMLYGQGGERGVGD